ncbi:WD40-repeat-containing domain protein, partial [Dunaliella salina]
MLNKDGSHAVTYSKDCTARIWSVHDNAVLHVVTGHTDGICYATLCPNESLLATASYAPTVHIHFMSDASPLAILDHEVPATILEFSPDSNLLAAILENHQVVLWNLAANDCLPPLQAHKGPITGAAFSPDSTMLATCSAVSGICCIWDAIPYLITA